MSLKLLFLLLGIGLSQASVYTDYAHPVKMGWVEIDTTVLDGQKIYDTAWVIKYPHVYMGNLKRKNK